MTSTETKSNISDSIGVLEKRITELEVKVHNQTQRELGKSKPVSDQILLINKLLNSKVPAIEKTNDTIEKLIKVSNMYLDHQYIDDKINIILSSENQIRELVELCAQIKSKQHVIDDEKYKSVPRHSETLNKLTEDQVRMFDEVKRQNQDVAVLMDKYNDIVQKINESLLAFHNTIDIIKGNDESK
ncbi:hypothetical protein WDU94_003040 [Cyamophila willieti]